jgi:TPR repeat protein
MRFVIAVILLCLSLDTAEAGYNEGMAAYERSNYKTAMRELLPLAQAGDALAQTYVGVMYQHGLGVRGDITKAVGWYTRAADAGDPMAQRILGDLHAGGLGGAPDYAAAVQWYRAAAKGGDDEARRKLRELIRKGRGTTRKPKTVARRRDKPSGKSSSRAKSKTTDTRVSRPTRKRKKRRGGQKASLRSLTPCFSGRLDDPYKIEVKIKFPESSVDHSRTVAELGSIARSVYTILGLMKENLHVETLQKPKAIPMDKKLCFWLTGFEVVLRYPKVDVFVASEYPWGSCPYKAILAHEEEHVDVARRNLDKFAPLIEKALDSTLIPTGRNAALFESPDDARQHMLDLADEILEPIVEAMIKALKKAQKIVDSPQSYARVWRRCSHWQRTSIP